MIDLCVEMEVINVTKKSNMEKLTINLPPVEIARIDVLVENGLYPSRSEFIRSSIRKTLDIHNEIIGKKFKEKNFSIGVYHISKNQIMKAISSGKKLSIKVAGLLIIGRDVTADLVRKGIESIKVYGIIKGSTQVKKEFSKLKSFEIPVDFENSK